MVALHNYSSPVLLWHTIWISPLLHIDATVTAWRIGWVGGGAVVSGRHYRSCVDPPRQQFDLYPALILPHLSLVSSVQPVLFI